MNSSSSCESVVVSDVMVLPWVRTALEFDLKTSVLRSEETI